MDMHEKKVKIELFNDNGFEVSKEFYRRAQNEMLQYDTPLFTF
jgi:hypothetical protein